MGDDEPHVTISSRHAAEKVVCVILNLKTKYKLLFFLSHHQMKRKIGVAAQQTSKQQNTSSTDEPVSRRCLLPPIVNTRSRTAQQHSGTSQRQSPPRSSPPAATPPHVAPDEAIRWILPETSKNFSKALKKTIRAKVEAARLSNEVHEVLDRRCRAIIHERVLARAILSPPTVEDEGSQLEMHSIAPALSAQQKQQMLKAQSEKEEEKAIAAKVRRHVAEQTFFDHVTRSCDDPLSVDAQLQRRKQWKVVIATTFLYLRNTIAAAGGGGVGGVGAQVRRNPTPALSGRASNEVSEAYWRLRPFELQPPMPTSFSTSLHVQETAGGARGKQLANSGGAFTASTKLAANIRRVSRAHPIDGAINEQQQQQHQRSESPSGSLSPSPSPVSHSRHRGWALYRASIVLKWACKESRRNVAVDRIINMIRGAQRMAKFHQAMGVFRRKLLLTQRLVRDHLSLVRARRHIFEVAWERNIEWVKDQLLEHFDPAKKWRKAIAKAQDDIAAAKRHADRVAIAEAAALQIENEARAKIVEAPTSSNSIAVPAAAFLLAENSFIFAQNIMRDNTSSMEDGPDWLHRYASNGSVDLFFDDSGGGMSLPRLRRSQSIVADDAVWRPLEFKRRQSMALMHPLASPPPAVLSSPVESGGAGGGSGSGSHPSSPTSPTLSRPGGGDSAHKIDLVRMILDGTIPEQRKNVMIRRLKNHLQEYNQLHNDAYATAMSVYLFDRAEYLQKRQSGKGAGLPVPRKPRPRFRSAVTPAHLMRALQMAEWEEHIMRTMATQMVVTSPTLSSPTSRFPAAAMPRQQAPLNILFPAQLDDHRLAIARFRMEGKQIAKRKREIAAEIRRREESMREVEPAQFPAVSRRDTVRLLVIPKAGDKA
jgi:hypothetical protein